MIYFKDKETQSHKDSESLDSATLNLCDFEPLSLSDFSKITTSNKCCICLSSSEYSLADTPSNTTLIIFLILSLL